MRDDLRGALAALGGDQVSALYASPVTDACDAENLLFYNVGATAFRQLSSRRLRFERAYEVPAPPLALTSLAAHYHRYRSGTPGDRFEQWDMRAILASFADVALPQLTETTKPAYIWWALCNADLDLRRDSGFVDCFGMSITVRTSTAVTAAQVVKPLLDGVVSALHAHDGTRLEVVADRIAKQLGTRAATVAASLVDDDRAVLGRRALVVPRAASVQWLPGDDRCVACDLTIERDPTLLRPTIDGTVLSVTLRRSQPSTS